MLYCYKILPYGNVHLFVSQVYFRKVETTYTEASIPVNSATEIRKRPPSICASTRGNVMQKAKVLLKKTKDVFFQKWKSHAIPQILRTFCLVLFPTLGMGVKEGDLMLTGCKVRTACVFEETSVKWSETSQWTGIQQRFVYIYAQKLLIHLWPEDSLVPFSVTVSPISSALCFKGNKGHLITNSSTNWIIYTVNLLSYRLSEGSRCHFSIIHHDLRKTSEIVDCNSSSSLFWPPYCIHTHITKTGSTININYMGI